MLEPSAEREHGAHAPTQAPIASPATARVRPSSFKYYIHDSTEALRLKLIGEFTQREVTELNGCWRTARTTIGQRKLVLDLRGLIAVDEAAKQWLAAMSAEGASYIPEDYLLTCVAGQHALSPQSTSTPGRVGIFRKLAGLFRGAPSAQSFTQEQ